jgi:molecular chaperone HtpG
MSTQTETHAFEAEVREVLSLVIHSLYTNREIFLRELISNASDALDKLRFEALTDATLLEEGEELGIALDVDKESRTLRVADNGIGMTHDELVQNLGTIASSGTRRFLAAVQESNAAERPELIGQFGVGFYSAFMVADEVVVETRRAGSEDGWRWTSSGDGEYSVEPAEGLARGTVVSLRLREVEGNAPDFSAEWTLREVVQRYSDFVEYPIQMEVERTGPKLDEDGEPIEGETESTRKLETLNSQKPLWARPRGEVQEEEYHEFYRHLSHDWNPPLETVHLKAEGALEFTALLFLPKERPLDMFDPQHKGSSLSLYVRRVLIMRECEELLPPWLRFVRGVVESSDLPLNVSRETLQDNPQVRQIKKRLVKKVLSTLKGILGEERERYEGFWEAFGLVLKEGIWFGEDKDAAISSLCLFRTSTADGWRTLDEVLADAQEGQDALYYLTAPDLATAKASPHLETLAARGIEVLLLTDPVDEWVTQRLHEYSGKPLKAVDRGDTELEDEEQKKRREERQQEHEGLLGALQGALAEDISEVRFSSRLKDSAAVLVAAEHGMSAHLERMLRRSGQDVPTQKRILEINPDHALVAALAKLHDVDAKSPRVAEFAELLHGQALLAEGSALKDPARFGKLVTQLMVSAIDG